MASPRIATAPSAIREDVRRLRATYETREVVRLVARRGLEHGRGVIREMYLRFELPLDGAVWGPVSRVPEWPDFRVRGLNLLPAVRQFESFLERDAAPSTVDAIVRCADGLLAHRFRNAGWPETQLGSPIDWSHDYTSDVRWPRSHFWRLKTVYGGASDIMVPWTLSWCQHMPILAAAYRLTQNERYVREIRDQIEDWIGANPVELGVNWMSSMNAAVRVANWAAALTMVADALPSDGFRTGALLSMFEHGRFISAYKVHEPHNNHYVACLVSLLLLAGLFPETEPAPAWREDASAGLVQEMAHQVTVDGCDNEGSLTYHALVAELFLSGFHTARAMGIGLPRWYEQRLGRMLTFIEDYTQPSGRAPQIGDSGSWRFLPLEEYAVARRPNSHLPILRRAARRPVPRRRSVAYREGGYWILTRGPLHVVVRCGGVSSFHSHHDQLSFELAYGGDAVVVDPGTFVYASADAAAREQFKSARYHSTLDLGGTEVRRVRSSGRGFPQQCVPSCMLEWRPDAEEPSLHGEYRGWEVLSSPAVHRRRVTLSASGTAMVVRDEIESDGAHDLVWTFPILAAEIAVVDDAVRILLDGVRVELRSVGAELLLEDGWYSPDYGARHRASFVTARRRSIPGLDGAEFVFAFEAR